MSRKNPREIFEEFREIISEYICEDTQEEFQGIFLKYLGRNASKTSGQKRWIPG